MTRVPEELSVASVQPTCRLYKTLVFGRLKGKAPENKALLETSSRSANDIQNDIRSKTP
jgi:hypothetical protein